MEIFAIGRMFRPQDVQGCQDSIENGFSLIGVVNRTSGTLWGGGPVVGVSRQHDQGSLMGSVSLCDEQLLKMSC